MVRRLNLLASLNFLFLVSILSFGSVVSHAAEKELPPKTPATLLGPAPPYVPRNSDYSLELGLSNSNYELFWVGGTIGSHLGTCVFVETETCQQYLDGHLGFKVREAETHFNALASLRWQYVNFPDRHSYFWRVLGGTAHIQRSISKAWHPVVGGGFGVTTYLHDRFDLRLEVRGGYADRPFAEALMGLEVKADKFLTLFAKKLRDIGFGTVETAIEATSTTIEATGEGLGEIVEGVSSTVKEQMKKDSPTKDSRKKDSPKK